jgi:hypothetical protein
MIRAARHATFALMLVSAGCASSGGGSGAAQPFSAARPTTIRIIVQNLNFQDARLYTYRRGTRSMLGTVTGKTNAEFVIDWDLPEPMYMEIDMLAGPRCFTEELRADPGDIMELQISSHFFDSPSCRRR